MKPALDAADMRILSALQEDGSLSISDVGERIHLSTNAVWRRLRRLEDEGYILKRVALIDPVKLGLGVVAHVSLRLTEQSAETMQRFIDSTRRMRQVTEISAMSGDMGFFLKTYSPDLAAHERMIAELLDKNSFSFIRSEFVLRSIHCTTALPIG